MMGKLSGIRWAKALTLTLTLLGTLSLSGGSAALAQAPPVTERKVTLNLKDVPLRNAIDALFQGSGLQYAVDPNVPNVPVTLNLRDVSLQSALRILMRQAAVAVPGLTSSRESDIYVIRIRQQAPQSIQPTAEEAPPEFGDAQTEVTWEKIPVQFNNAAVFMMAFGGQMLPTEADVLGGGMGGMGGGMGGMMGGMGGMGGGMMGGGMGGMMGGGMMGGGMGGMMGGMGGMGGGMMGGMGGMMGGMGGMMGGMGGMGGGFGGMGGLGGGGGFGGGGFGGGRRF